MANVYNYIKNYGDRTFKEEPFNEIDNVIFSSVIYLNFTNIVSKNKKYIKLSEAGNKYLNKYNYFEVCKYGIAQKISYKILKRIVNTKRYRDVFMYNFEYIGDKEKQFGAVCFKVKKQFIYVAFEGTDNLISGWKEDFEMAYKFPVFSQELAIKYLNKNIKFYDKNIIIGGHSKGGNLALISSMYTKKHIQKKIKKIYSNDGPGIRKEQIESKKYLNVKDRYEHIIPNYSYVGILLRNEKYTIIKSSRVDVMAHSVSTWQIEQNKFKREKLSTISSNFEKSIIMWLDEHNDMQRKKMILGVFNAIEESGISDIIDFFNMKKTVNLIKKLKNIDDETKELVISFIKFNLNYIINQK